MAQGVRRHAFEPGPLARTRECLLDVLDPLASPLDDVIGLGELAGAHEFLAHDSGHRYRGAALVGFRPVGVDVGDQPEIGMGAGGRRARNGSRLKPRDYATGRARGRLPPAATCELTAVDVPDAPRGKFQCPSPGDVHESFRDDNSQNLVYCCTAIPRSCGARALILCPASASNVI